MIAASAVAGWVLAQRIPNLLRGEAHAAQSGPEPLIPDGDLHVEAPSGRRALRVAVLGLSLWWAPVLVVLAVAGTHSVFTTQALLFSGAAVVTFGGAYAVLAFVAQRAVEDYGWLAPGEMARGLALAATIGALLTTWVTFAPRSRSRSSPSS